MKVEEAIKQCNELINSDIVETIYCDKCKHDCTNECVEEGCLYGKAIETVLKDREELLNYLGLVGLTVKNKNSGRIGIVLRQWESGSVAVLENIMPRIITTHDNWNTLEIVNNIYENKEEE